MASVNLTPEYFSSPLTTELFDRNRNQREERSKLVAGFALRGSSPKEATLKANREMFLRFQDRVTDDIDSRHEAMIAAGVAENEGPALDARALRLQATIDIMNELELLNNVLPLPGLERMAAQAGAQEGISA